VTSPATPCFAPFFPRCGASFAVEVPAPLPVSPPLHHHLTRSGTYDAVRKSPVGFLLLRVPVLSNHLCFFLTCYVRSLFRCPLPRSPRVDSPPAIFPPAPPRFYSLMRFLFTLTHSSRFGFATRDCCLPQRCPGTRVLIVTPLGRPSWHAPHLSSLDPHMTPLSTEDPPALPADTGWPGTAPLSSSNRISSVPFPSVPLFDLLQYPPPAQTLAPFCFLSLRFQLWSALRPRSCFAVPFKPLPGLFGLQSLFGVSGETTHARPRIETLRPLPDLSLFLFVVPSIFIGRCTRLHLSLRSNPGVKP